MEQGSDSEFWDEGINSTQKNQPRKQIERSGSSQFPSLSVYLSHQESQKEILKQNKNGHIDDSLLPKTIILANHENTKEINDKSLIKENKHKYDNKNSKEVESEHSSSTRKSESDDSDESEPKPKERCHRSSTDERATIYVQSPSERLSSLEEESDNEILFFDNSEPIKNMSQMRRMSWGQMDFLSVSPGKKLINRPSKRKNAIQPKSEDDNNLIGSVLCPPHQLLKYWLHRGRKLMMLSEGNMAVDAFIRSFALARMVHGDKDWRTARCKVFLARSYFYLLGYAQQAISHATEATETICAKLPSSIYMNKKPQIHHTLSWAFLLQGEAKLTQNTNTNSNALYSKALIHCKKFKTLVSRRKKLKPSMQMDHPLELIIKIMRAQAECYQKINIFPKAREKLEEAITIVNKCIDLERRDQLMGPLLKDLGDLMLRYPGTLKEGLIDQDQEKDKKNGFECLAKSLAITQNNQRPGNENECEVRFLIVQNQIKYKRIPVKEILWELHKLKIWSVRLHGEAANQTRAIQECLIQVLLNEGSYRDAISEQQNLLQNVRNHYGDYSTQVCTLLRRLSNTYVLQNDFSNALLVLDHCLLVETLIYGANSRKVQTLKMKIKDLLYQVPQSVKKKILRNHPDLQQRPPFKSYC